MSNCSELVYAALEELEVADPAQVAEKAEVSPTTATKWLRTFVEEGKAQLHPTRYGPGGTGRNEYEFVPLDERRTPTPPTAPEANQGAVMPITAQAVIEHLYHPVANAPHMVVCTCGEIFYALPAEEKVTPAEAWAFHLAHKLTGGPS